MSVDTYRIDQASGLFHIVWTAPISCIVTLVLLVVNLTYSALAGFALLVIGMPLLTRAIKSLFTRRKKINKIDRSASEPDQEILQSVRFVKFFGVGERLRQARLGDLPQPRNRRDPGAPRPSETESWPSACRSPSLLPCCSSSSPIL